MSDGAFGVRLLNEFTRETIFFSTEEDILNFRRKVINEFNKYEGKDGNKYEQMKPIF